jgi:RNA polymerase-binding transcription factor DksA
MISEKEKVRFRGMLAGRRDEIFRLRQALVRSRQRLSEPEIEPEETAAKEKISSDVDFLEEREKQEIEAIDRALRRLETGSYGICEICGKEISVGRLEALPWTVVCKQCAGVRDESGAAPDSEIGAGATASDYEGLSDEELAYAIRERLRYDGRVDLEELEISCREGTVYLRGYVASETKRRILLDILQNSMGLKKVVDHVAAERLLWQREDRAPGERPAERDEEALFEGEAVDSEEEGLSRSPADTLVPEKEE